MPLITKQDVLKAFQNNKMKRNNLLFEYYKDTLFFKGLTAEFIAEKISKDLGLSISPTIIYKINHRIIKRSRQSPTRPVPAAPHTFLPEKEKPNQEENKGDMPNQVSTEWEFRNADEYPPKDPFGAAFDDL